MEISTAKLILDRLNEAVDIDYNVLNEAEVLSIIINAEKENVAFLAQDK